MGFVSTIVAFIQAFQGNRGLFFAVALVLGILLIGVSLISVLSRKRVIRPQLPGGLPGSPQVQSYYGRAQRRLATFGLSVWVLLLLGLGVWFIPKQLLGLDASDKFVVLVADFDGPDEAFGVTETIISNLRTATEDIHNTEIIALGRKITAQEGSAHARSIGKERGADIVLWGWYRVPEPAAPEDRANVTVHFEVMEELRSVAFKGEQPANFLETNKKHSEHVSIAELRSFQVQSRISTEVGQLTLLTLGLVHYEGQDFNGAIERLTAGIEQSDDLETSTRHTTKLLLYYRGTAYLRNGEYDLAILDYDRVIELDPDDAIAYNNRGIVYHGKRAYDRAISDYDRAIELNPDDAIAYYNRGLANHGKRAYDRAISDYDRAIELNPDNAIAYRNRGIVYQAKGAYDRAISDYDRAIELDPDNANAYYNRGLAYYEKRAYDRAISDYDRVIELDPDDADAYTNRGLAHYEKGEYDLAISDYNQAIELDPDDAIAYRNRGIVYQKQGAYDRAGIDFERFRQRFRRSSNH